MAAQAWTPPPTSFAGLGRGDFGRGAGRPRQRVLVLRHGSRPTSTADPPLDSRGERQAQEVAQYFARPEVRAPLQRTPITAIYCSPFKRALQTAGPVAAALGLPIRVEWGFCELLADGWLHSGDPLPKVRRSSGQLAQLVSPGRIDTSYDSAVMPEYPDLYGRLYGHGSARDLGKRDKALDRHRRAVEAALRSCGGSGSLLIVGHGSTHDFVSDALCGEQWQHMEQWHTPHCVDHCAVTEIVEQDYPKGWHLSSFGGLPWKSDDRLQATLEAQIHANWAVAFAENAASEARVAASSAEKEAPDKRPF